MRHPLVWTAASALLWTLALLSPAPRGSMILKGWGLWLAWSALSCAVSEQPLKGLFPLSRWLGILAFFGLVLDAWGEEERRRWFWGLCLCGGVLGMAALAGGGAQALHGDGHALVGLLPPYYNYTAFVMAACAAAALAALGHPRAPQGLARVGLMAGLSLFITVLLLSRSRQSLLGLLMASLFWAYRKGKTLWLLGGGLACLAALSLASTDWLVYFLKLEKLSSFKRPQIWAAAIHVAAEHPILGEGPGNFTKGFLRHNFPSSEGPRNLPLSGRFRHSETPPMAGNFGMYTEHAHSEPLEIAAETGWVGLALFLLALKRVLPRPKGSIEQEAALCAVAAMVVPCLIDNMLHIPGLALLFFSALAVARGPSAERALSPSSWRLWGRAGAALSLVAWAPSHLVSSYEARSRAEEDPSLRFQLIQKALKIFPQDYYLHETLARAWLEMTPPRMGEALSELETAQRLYPTNALYPAMRAEILFVQGRRDQAEALASETLRLEPNFLQVRLLLARVWLAKGQRSRAQRELEEIQARQEWLKTTVPYSGYDRTIIHLDQGAFDELRRLLR